MYLTYARTYLTQNADITYECRYVQVSAEGGNPALWNAVIACDKPVAEARIKDLDHILSNMKLASLNLTQHPSPLPISETPISIYN